MATRYVAAATLLALAVIALTAHVRQESRSAQEASRLLEIMMRSAEEPWGTPASCEAARQFVVSFPHSAWASEAWRMLALDAQRRGDREAEFECWKGYLEAFGDAQVPGAALAHIELGRVCGLNADAASALRHHENAWKIMTWRRWSVQQHLGAQAAVGAATMCRKLGMPARAMGWESRVTWHETPWQEHEKG